jgi:hypothetical protein
MLHGSPRPDVAGSELIHLLTRLAGAPPKHSAPAFAERLGHWLGWSDAIALSTALDGTFVSGHGGSRGHGNEEADFQGVRAALEASIAAGPREGESSATDFGPHRHHCIALQQAMHDAVGALRQRLREALSRHSPALARLAGIDAVMDRTLAARERGLLSLVPQRLQMHFERLQHAGGDHSDWLRAFRDDMRLVLRAELTHRLLTPRGLLDTLHTHRPPT